MLELTERFVSDDSAGTSIEYGLVAAGIAVGIMMAVVSLGTRLKSTLAQITGSPLQASNAASGRPALYDGP
jgi:pilus assembly protein Flp/PilA